jgi:Mg-chelatase subunit ChlD
MKPLAVGAMVEADFWPECVRVALEYERAQGRGTEGVSSETLGYDIRSTAPDGAVRSIEVKARARTGASALTPNEWLMAQRSGSECWLDVVEHAATAAELYVVQDPRRGGALTRWARSCATW